jgi:hypothetical protein
MCNCQDCGQPISPARLELLPDTEYCVKCSDAHTFKYVAHMIYPHKTGGDLFVARTQEGARRLTREAIRGR